MEDEVFVPIPNIQQVTIFKRFRWPKKDDNDLMASVPTTFLPPNNIEMWPKKIEDITDHYVKEVLEYTDSDAIGS
jgi:hypothetical protein